MKARWIGYSLIALIVLGAVVHGAFVFTPWPSVLLIRHAFDEDAARRNLALEKHLPAGVVARRDLRYGDSGDMQLDVFFPKDGVGSGKVLPTILWIHGGAFISGSKDDVRAYLQILAARGYVTVGLDYSLAPGARYPTPVTQANDALAFVVSNAERWHSDAGRIILAGDSAGAQIAAQLAAAIGDPGYAATLGVAPAIAPTELKGIVLFCGVYDAWQINMQGEFGEFIRTVMWSYFGTPDFLDDPRLDGFSVNRHLTGLFPRTFISVGNADPLASQSVMLADAIRRQGVDVDELFFPAEYRPALAHEYQFDLDTEAGRVALGRLTGFLRGLSE